MSNLRWILLFAGLAILLILYFSGKPRKVRRTQQRHDGYSHSHAAASAGLVPEGDPLMDAPRNDPYARYEAPQQDAHYGGSDPRQSSLDEFDPAEFDSEDFERPGGQPGQHHAQTAADPYSVDHYAQNQPYTSVETTAPASMAPAESVAVAPAPSTPTTLGGKLDALSARLTGRNKSVNQTGAPENEEQPEQKVILLHVVAPEGQIIDGQLLLQVFEQRRYHFGEMNIFHSLHQEQTVFSIAKMVEPGSFDVNDLSSFETPGLVLILQLPGPVAADVAFEVLVSEAQELADALGCRVLDSKRSTLSRQTTQHLRESVSDYVHRQKYLNKVTH